MTHATTAGPRFCGREGCYEVAVGVSTWDRDAPRPEPLCRPHRLDGLATVRCEVIGPLAITDVRTQQGIGKGGQVELDPVETNIAQLVYAGHVKVLPVAESGPERVQRGAKVKGSSDA
jgi:hypothetical protein